MEINSNKKLSLLELESLRSELIDKTLNTSSNNLRLYLYQYYFEKILSLNNPNYEEAFLKEFLDDFIDSIKKSDVWGNEPGVTKKLFELLDIISNRAFAKEKNTTLDIEIKRIELQWIKLTTILNGDDLEEGENHEAFFPLVDNESPSDFYGVVETVTVRIGKAVEVDKFIIVPSEKEIEKRIFEQCQISWQLALKISKQYVKKPFKFHEVIISFDKKQGFYEGNSLGIALTLSFLEQILKFYNPTYVINLIEKSAFTGGVDENGKILNTSEDIIKRKVSAIFYSQINSFVIPKLEETYAYFSLTQLKKNYPNRKLKLIPAEDIDDVLNRRDVVDIKKQKLVVRGGKFVKKNWISAVATVLLAILFAYLFVMDFDDNPAIFSVDGKNISIKNKKQKILWVKPFFATIDQIVDIRLCSYNVRILDINDDGKNEVLLNYNQGGYAELMGRKDGLFCFDYKGNLIWQHIFDLKVGAIREDLSIYYNLTLIGKDFSLFKKKFYLIANNIGSFSSAIYSIDLNNGKIQDGILWNSGHTVEAIIVNNDGKKDIFGFGWDNGYEDIVFFGFTPDNTITARKTIDSYQLKDLPVAELKFYCRIPKTDFDNFNGHRTPTFTYGPFTQENIEKNINIIIGSYNDKTYARYGIQFDTDLIVKTINIANDFRVQRDSLVVKGLLNPPYTDTEGYKEILKNNILYWKDGKWVNRNGVEKK